MVAVGLWYGQAGINYGQQAQLHFMDDYLKIP
jgi:hypothetical protein